MSKHQTGPKVKEKAATSGKPSVAAGKLALLGCACFFCKAVGASAGATSLTTGRPAQGASAFAVELVSQAINIKAPMAFSE